MPKYQSLLLLSLISIGLTACGGGGGGSTPPTKPASSLSSSIASSAAPASSSSSSVYSANVDNLHSLAVGFPVGIAVSNTDSPPYNVLTNASEKAIVERHFNEMTAGNIMKMSYLQPTQGNFNFTDADAFVDYAKDKNINVHGHALLWHSDYQVPEFMKVSQTVTRNGQQVQIGWNGTSEDFLTALETHITNTVNHFNEKDNVVSWDVVNEALSDETPSNFRTDSAFYINSDNSEVYIEKAFQAARAANPNITLYYNDYNIDQNNSKTDKLLEMITDFQARDIPLDGIGFQMHVCLNFPTAATIAAALKKVADKGLLVKITELDVAINQPYCDNYPAKKINTFSESVALAQKKRYCEIVKAYLDSVPQEQRGGITVWGTTDANTWLDDLYKTQFGNKKISWPLLFDSNYNDKPALRGFADGLLGTACSN
jgi:endo-1,4-beta-xylanase